MVSAAAPDCAAPGSSALDSVAAAELLVAGEAAAGDSAGLVCAVRTASSLLANRQNRTQNRNCFITPVSHAPIISELPAGKRERNSTAVWCWPRTGRFLTGPRRAQLRTAERGTRPRGKALPGARTILTRAIRIRCDRIFSVRGTSK